ncbi:MAG: carotenoid 1,2-hydratase [Chromatiales bacterium]|nr:carotenoid 1,2-hydratase [Chromatiales bacterium]
MYIKIAAWGILLLGMVLLVPANWARAEDAPRVDYIELLQGTEQSQFKRVIAPRPFQFPQDHGAHPDYRLEWWYFSGNLGDSENRRYGFQLTLFRYALARGEAPGWKSPQLYVGHFAVTDQLTNRHYGFERIGRQGAGVSGVQLNPFEAWIDGWSIKSETVDGLFPLRLEAVATAPSLGAVSLSLRLEQSKPLVLQGEEGYSPKSATPGNASHYYSYTRLAATGELTLGERKTRVSGSAWLDREWSSSSLDESQAGWDWFSLQLDDGRDLMFYQLRGKSGEMDPYSKGVLVAADGRYAPIEPAEIELIPLKYWYSDDGRRYPIKWQLKMPSQGLELTVVPLIEDQEWKQRLRYWEGAVVVSGSHTGRGYLELAGY